MNPSDDDDNWSPPSWRERLKSNLKQAWTFLKQLTLLLFVTSILIMAVLAWQSFSCSYEDLHGFVSHMDDTTLVLNKELELDGPLPLSPAPEQPPSVVLQRGDWLVVEECGRVEGEVWITVRSGTRSGGTDCKGNPAKTSACKACKQALTQ